MKLLENITLEKCLLRLLTAWSIVGTFLLVLNPQKYDNIDFFKNINFPLVLLIVLLVFIAITMLLSRTKGMRFEKLLLFFFVFLYFGISLTVRADIYYYLGVMTIMGILLFYCFKDSSAELIVPAGLTKAGFVALAVLIAVFIGGLTTLRYLSYNSPGFDFGIFTQMFHNMKTSFLPNTTVELDRLSSHFAVHVSPIYYLILPFYMIFPSPVTLQISQAVILAVGFIPLYLLCKSFKLSDFSILFIGICFAFYPALAGGCFYDIHENAFLTPLILWLFYFIEKNKMWGMLVFSLLIFAVKEDAPIYVAFIALYIIFGKKQYKRGTVILILSVLYFIFVLWLLKTHGEGAKFDRYDNYNFDGSGLVGVLKSVVINPAYVLSQSMTQEKFVFLLQMLVPLAFLPLINKDFAKYILIGPFILVNLMSNYEYQHSIDFQYNFGVIALFFYLLISNISNMKPRVQKGLALYCAVASIFLFSATMVKKVSYIGEYSSAKVEITSFEKCFSMIPKDADVSASSFTIAHLYEHQTLYELPTNNKTEYIVVDLRVNTKGVSVLDYKNESFEELYYDDGIVALYKKN